jgi:hypothetical protein
VAAPQTRSEGIAARILVAVAVVVTAAVVTAYVSLIRGQGGPPTPDVLTVPFLAAYQVVMALLLVASLLVSPAVRPALRAAPAGGLLVLGWLGAMSIGIPLLLAAGLAMGATVLAIDARPGRQVVVSVAIAAAVAIAVLVTGFEFSWHYLVCPPTGESGGTTASFLGHASSYDCNNGVLTVH